MAADRINVCFHGVGHRALEREDGESGYWVSTNQFLELLDDIATWPEEVALSFDDGNRSDIEIALPALLERGLTATFFPVAGRLGDRESIAADEVSLLIQHGMQVGTHGMHHRPWRGLDDRGLEEELVAARRLIEGAAGRPVTEAALPLGRYDRRVLGALHTLGYARVHSSDRRPARSAAWLQPRFSVRADHSPASLRREVESSRTLRARLRATAVGAIKRLR